MKTKAQIVQDLLEKKLITVEDAMVLLMADQTPVYISYPYPYPVLPYIGYPAYPWNPYSPIFRTEAHGTVNSFLSGNLTFIE